MNDHKQRRNKSLDSKKEHEKKQEERFNAFIESLEKQEEVYKSAISQQTEKKMQKSVLTVGFYQEKCA